MSAIFALPPTPPVALVTGAPARVGAALARRLGREGFAVLVHYRTSADKAQNVVAEIIAAGGRAAAVPERYRIIDADRSVDAIACDVWARVAEAFPEVSGTI